MRLKPIVYGSVTVAEVDNKNAIDEMAKAGSRTEGAVLINVAPVIDRAFTHYAFAGRPEAVSEAILKVSIMAFEILKLKANSPRSGVVDTVIFIPVQGITLSECKQLTKKFIKSLYEKRKVPVFYQNYKSYQLYREYANLILERGIRGISERMTEGIVKPILGAESFRKNKGVLFATARPPVIRFVVNISTYDPDTSYRIARRFDSSSHSNLWSSETVINGHGENKFKIPNKFKGVKAFGVPNDFLKIQQISFVIYDTEAVGLHQLFEAAKYEVQDLGTEVISSEIQGYTNKKPLIEAAKFYVGKGFSEEEYIGKAIENLKLDQTHYFVPEAKIIEYLVKGIS